MYKNLQLMYSRRLRLYMNFDFLYKESKFRGRVREFAPP